MGKKEVIALEVTLIVVIFLLSFLIVNRMIAMHTGIAKSYVYNNGQQSFASRQLSSSNIVPFSGSSDILSNSIIKNEFVGTISNSIYSSNFYFNERFYPGNVSVSSNGYSCSIVNEIKGPHLCLNLFSLFSCGGGPKLGSLSNLVGYLGFSQQDFNFPNNQRVNYSNLYSASQPGTSQVYQLPPTWEYQNFINWSPSSIHSYSASPFGSHYMYAINNSFTGYPTIPGSLSKSTLIIPAVSCGATFINDFVTYPGFLNAIYDLSTLSGFTPSVYLASNDESSFGADYGLGYLLVGNSFPWTHSTFNSLLAYQIQSTYPAFNYTMPSENYAQFPSGNKGDIQYVNVTGEFLTPLSMSYYGGSSNSNVSIYLSNTSIASIKITSSSENVCRPGPRGGCIGYTQEIVTSKNADTFTDPNLQSAYYPNYNNGLYVNFRTDGVFPICAWNKLTGNILSSCTFENSSTMNSITYQRLWLSNNLKNNQLYNKPFTPGYAASNLQNNFTLTALNSFCFYGEHFSTSDGVYTSPSYTRIIPPTSAENYTSSIGKCNAFFNNTNCFSTSSGQYLNFKDGIFSNNIACTPSGIHANNITDAWISSIFVANDAGKYCGDFLGQKNPTNPQANSTIFLQQISNNCPSFNANASSVNLVVTVKNVGNSEIKNPYLIALYGNNNLSTIFPNSQNDIFTTYNLYKSFLSAMSATTGIMQVDYNSQLNTNMYVFDKGHPLNPIPVNSLFLSGEGYINGPFDNSLLGMFIYNKNYGLPNNVIRTSNVVLSHSSSGNSQVPVILPNGTATFTIQVPMSLFKVLLSGEYNLSVFFGNTFNASWNGGSSPATTMQNPGQTLVNPLVSSSTVNSSQIHNNELFFKNSGLPSPLWQYIVSYNFNMAESPFSSVGLYNDNISVSVSSFNSTSNALNVTVNPSVSVFNGSGSYNLGSDALTGSSISCFASPDNLQDFGVFWSRSIVSPSNLNYALSSSIYSGEQKQASDILITSWTGMLFMPYSDQVALNYNNLPHYYPSSVSFQLEKPTLNTTSNQFSYEAFDYFGRGSKNNVFAGLSNSYSLLNTSVSSFPVSLPSSSLAFTLVSNSLVSDPSVLRIVGTDTFVNYSTFSNESFDFSVTSNGALSCSGSEYTSENSTYSISNTMFSSCLSNVVVNKSYVTISSSHGPFFVDMYNNSNLNISNETAGNTVLMGGNETLSKAGGNGQFQITIPINTSVNNGVTFVFSPVPLTRHLYNAKVYLYNINGTPFNCNIVNDFNNTGNLGVSQIGVGTYSLPNGTMMCNLTTDFTYLRAVFVNSSNDVYLGSGDIQSGLTISNISSSSNNALNVSINGIPVNAQNAEILSPQKYDGCNVTSPENIYNGILKYPTGCYNLSYAFITFDYNNNGTQLLESAVISPKNYHRHGLDFMYSSPSVVTTSPVSEYNLTIPDTSASGIPVQFSIPNNFGGCNNIILTSQFPYPYAEIPYQVISSSPASCDYVFVNSVSQGYSVFATNSPSIVYPNNWLNYTNSQYNVQFSTSTFGGDVISNCQSGFGPCIDSFSVGDKNIGNLLFNNVSTSSATVSQSINGPVEDCFTVSYSSSQTVNFPETGFGSINYANNKVYQTASPSQSITSQYCFYAGSSVITDSIFASGSPINFKVQNQLISNFSYIEDSNNRVFSVPPAIEVGYSSYDNVNVSAINITAYNITGVNFPSKCANYTLTGSNASLTSFSQTNGTNISSSYMNSSVGPRYCFYGGRPSYTPEFSLGSKNNSNSSTGLGFAYQPGNYTNGVGTLYDSCLTPGSLSISSEPLFYLNGKQVTYSGSTTENSLMGNSSNYAGSEMLFSKNGGVFINKCAPNTLILSSTTCTKLIGIIPQNGSYNGIEAIPSGSNGNLSFGGGCYIGMLNNVNYNCAPTDGALSYSLSSKSTTTSTVSVSNILLNKTIAPTSALQVSFDCSITASVTGSSNPVSNSCSYPNNKNSGICSASVSYSKINSTAYNITSECSAISTKSDTISKITTNKLSNLYITGSQSETTGLISPTTFLCGNNTNFINTNVINGWTWKPYSTAGSINPAPSTNTLGVAEVGGCEAGRYSFETQTPNITTNYSGNTPQQFYSCSPGYTGTITACSQGVSVANSTANIPPNTSSCYQDNVTLLNSTILNKIINGNNTGGLGTSCNAFSRSGYISPTVSDNCIAYPFPVVNSTYSSYELQYSNSSGYGLGMGIIGKSYELNVSIPNGKQQNSIKDSYFTGLSESQLQSGSDILTNILPTSLLESNLPSKALSISAAYSYDTLNILMLQNPSFGVSGIPGFVNGSILDYALSIFTGGTSGNCAQPYSKNGYGIFTLGEGELCSGRTLPSSYKNGVFLSLGSLNEGLHSLQFYSIGNTTNEAQPSVSVFDSVSNAVNLNNACTNGNKKVFTSVYNGGQWSFNITSDQQCTPVNNKLYGYIVNCLYQTPGNQTYTITSQYYLAYNLPTVWNISYSLLVSPKSYQVVPTPVYQINYSTGSILTFQHPNRTTFIEKGLPNGYKWSMTFDHISRTSSSSNIYYYSPGTHSFEVSTLSNRSSTSDCYTIYTSAPGSGSETSGTTTYIEFTGVTTCNSYFKQTGLPDGINWNVTYDGILGSTSNQGASASTQNGYVNVISGSLMEFITSNNGGFGGNFFYSVSDVHTSCSTYTPTPSSGYLLAGTNQTVSFSNSKCITKITTFNEGGLPAGIPWSVDYNGTTKTSTVSEINFTGLTGTYSFSVSTSFSPSILINNQPVGSCSYVPVPSSGNIPAGQVEKITFVKSCKQFFTYVSGGTSTSSLVIMLKNVSRGEKILVSNFINFGSTGGSAVISDSFGDSFYTTQSHFSQNAQIYYSSWEATASNTGNDTITITYPHPVTSYATAIGLVGYYLDTLNYYVNPNSCSITSITPNPGEFVFGICHAGGASSVDNTSGFYSMPPSESFAASEYSLHWPGGSTTVPFTVINSLTPIDDVLTISNVSPTTSATFSETGLPAGSSWSIFYHYTTFSSSSSSITAYSTNGSYSFTAENAIGVVCSSTSPAVFGVYYEYNYSPSPSQGTVTTPGSQTITYNKVSGTGTKTSVTCTG
jgi:hypothetical protein